MPEDQQFTDKTKECKDCHRPFVFTAKEQAFHQKMVAEKKWDSYKEPERCKPCRQLRKQNQPVK